MRQALAVGPIVSVQSATTNSTLNGVNFSPGPEVNKIALLAQLTAGTAATCTITVQGSLKSSSVAANDWVATSITSAAFTGAGVQQVGAVIDALWPYYRIVFTTATAGGATWIARLVCLS